MITGLCRLPDTYAESTCRYLRISVTLSVKKHGGVVETYQGGAVSPSKEQSAGSDWLRRQAGKVEEHDTLPVEEETASATPVEAWLQRRGVRYAPPTMIPMEMIDTRRSRSNQARKDPIVEDSVKRFTMAMKAGRSFPPIVVYPDFSKLIIIDGNNRHEAAISAKLTSIYGIVIDGTTDGDQIKLLTVEANASHGVTPPLDWRVRQAFHLVSIGHGDELSAEASGITLQQLRNARAAREAEQRAAALRVHKFADMSATSKQYLNGIKMEPVFYAAARMAVENCLTIEQVRDLCRAVKTGKSESEQLSIVAEQKSLLIRENAAKKALSKRINSPKNALGAGLGLVLNLDVEALVGQIQTTHDRDVIRARLREAEDKILAIQVEMEEKLKYMDVEG